MNIKNRVATNTEDIFESFNYKLDSNIVSAICIFHLDLGNGSNVISVYEVHLEIAVQHYAFVTEDHEQEMEDEVEFVKSWTKSRDVALMSAKEDEKTYDYNYLFRLTEPFGIQYK
jgi:hypothetical protein